MDVIAHGEYPFDMRQSPWRKVKSITEEEANALIPEGKVLLNKGFWVIGTDVPSASVLGLSFTTMTGGETGGGWPKGTKAVYQHDCRYYIIEVRQ